MAPSFQFLVKLVQKQIGENRRKGTALRRPFRCGFKPRERDGSRAQNPADEFHDPPVPYPIGYLRHEDVVVDTVEELLQIDVYHEGVSLSDMLLRLGNGLMRRPVGAKTVARR